MIPAAFLSRMRDLLGDDFAAFSFALSAPSRHALRVTLEKIEVERLLSLLPFTPTPLSFLPHGFLIPEEEAAGKHPLHHAGAYYMQDPSAMATVAALPLSLAGCRVLDLCAAPGGKTTQLSSAVGEGGFVLANEIVPSRARILLGNLERLGIRNTAVLSLSPAEVAALFDRYFDLVLVDAPCSGEGMFRKYPSAAAEWSERGVEAAAARSAKILDEAARTVREGGYLLFSTCTFSEEENEGAVCAFLRRHPEFTLLPLGDAVRRVTAPGIHRTGRPAEIASTRRFYPHLAEGEGQYLALLQRTAGGMGGPLFREGRRTPLPAAARDALAKLLPTPPTGEGCLFGSTALAIPEGMPLPPRGLVRAGVATLDLSGKQPMPHHHLAMAYGTELCRRLALSADDSGVRAYLRGEELSAPPDLSGFAALLFEGLPLGLVKCSGGRAKNHYPKGLRRSP